MILHLTDYLTRRECLDRADRLRAICLDLTVTHEWLARYQLQAFALHRAGEAK